MKEEKTIAQNKKTKTFKTVEPGVETAFLTSKNIPEGSSGKLELTKKIENFEDINSVATIELDENGRITYLKVKKGEESPFILTKKNNQIYLLERPRIQYLTPTPQIELFQENITKCLNQMDICFKLILVVCIYFFGHFMAAHPLPSPYGILNACNCICLIIIAWKCFFANKNATLDEVKKFFEQHSKPQNDLN